MSGLLSETPTDATPAHPRGGSRELLKLAIPLILANSFTTIQFTVDRAFLSQYDPDAMGASMPAALVFWLFQSMIFGTASYTSTFVAQYTGANRPERVGPAVWQGIYFALVSGVAFFLLWFAAPYMFDRNLTNHSAKQSILELDYFRSLCGAALPMGIVAAISGFFSGRGDSWTVMIVNAVGTIVNIGLDYLLIFGNFDFPAMGIVGAGYATVLGSWASAGFALWVFFRPKYREQFATVRGWRLEGDLMRRLLKYGLPSGMQWSLEAISFTLFTIFVGRLGEAASNATSLTFTLNMLGFLPMMGVGQAIAILVGQRLGEDRPDLAERSAILGVKWAFGYMVVIAAGYVLFPQVLLWGFAPPAGSPQAADWPAVAEIVPTLLIWVAVYSLADTFNVTFAFALRGAGDTRFVSLLTFALAWPCMIVPVYLLVTYGGNVYGAWGFASLYIGVIALCFWLRFRTGKWKTMRVIESAPDTLPA